MSERIKNLIDVMVWHAVRAGQNQMSHSLVCGNLKADILAEFANREAIMQQMAKALEELRGTVVAIDELRGTNLQVHGWHLNGEPEDFDRLVPSVFDASAKLEAALAAYGNPSLVSDKQARIDAVIKQLTDACQLHVDSDGNTEWARKQRSDRQNEAYDKALAALKALKEIQ